MRSARQGVLGLAGAILVATSLCGCEVGVEPPRKTPEPHEWQIHLKPVDLDKVETDVEETIYVPIYSRIYHEDFKRSVELTATLSVRNTDAKKPIILVAVDYFGTDGKLLKSYLSKPVQLDPMATADFVVARQDASGGSGANFIVRLLSEKHVSQPIAEAIMIGTGSSQAISFSSRGQTTNHEDKHSDDKKSEDQSKTHSD